MTLLLMFFGAVFAPFICAVLLDEPTGFTSAIFGACIGFLLGKINALRARLDLLERAAAQVREPAAPVVAAPDTIESIAPPPLRTPIPIAEAKPQVVLATVDFATTTSPPTNPTPVQATIASVPREEAHVNPPPEWIGRVKRWFTEGNVPVKVGVIVLFLGVAALLKYAADAGWLTVPIEFRLAGIAVLALAALVFAWRKRTSHRAFALSLQGGAIGILILTVFAAFRFYPLLPAALAFALLVVIVAGTGVLAVAQEALALAVLAVVAGFLAPILVSTGDGNHVVLFSYYALLNAMIFVVAWLRPWRALNVLGFLFTFGIGTGWGVLKYRQDLFASTEPFLLLFFAFYLFIPLFYARRLAPDRRELIDSALVFGLPLASFPLQAALLHGDKMPLAWSAVTAAAIYTALATLELKRLGIRLLGLSHALLALGFATLAVPLALSARATACAWALEGAALVWLGLRQQRKLPRWIGYGLQLAAGLAFLDGFEIPTDPTPILNGTFFSALLIAVGGFVSAWLVFRSDRKAPLATALLIWGWGWWWAACGHDIERFSPHAAMSDWWLVLIAVTGALGALAYRRFDWLAASWAALVSFALALPLLLLTSIDNHGALEGWASAAWLLWLATSLFSLLSLHARANPFLHIVHFAFLCVVTLVISSELAHLAFAHLALTEVWVGLAALAPAAVLFWLVLARNAFVRWPDRDAAESTRDTMLYALAAVLGLAWFAGLFVEGRPAPLPYLPLLNPLELSQFGYLLLLLAWYRRAETDGRSLVSAELRARGLSIAAFLLLTAITLRSAHILGRVPWSEALWTSALAQAALSIVWTIAGIAAMLLGKQRGSRAVWIGGGTLMGVVILKLIVIDRQHLHDLTAIVGVLVVGILLVGVGYFAPVPPKLKEETS